MSGQQPQPGSWPGPQGPAPWAAGPPPTRRRTGWIVVAVVAVLAILAGGGGIAAWQLTGGEDDPSVSGQPAPPDDPAPDDEPSEPEPEPAEPSPTPASTDPWGALGPGDEVVDVTLALEKAGYACYNTLDAAMLTPDQPITVNGQNVLIRRCYLDPATSRDEEQTVSLQAAPDGSVNGIRVVISAFLDRDGKRPSAWFRHVVRALTGSVLTRSEATAILAGQTPKLAWGTAELRVNAERTSYHLDLQAKDAKLSAVPATTTGLSLTQVRRHYSSEGYRCEQPRKIVVTCERSGRGHALVVTATDTCRGPNAASLPMCAGDKTVYGVTATAEFDSGLPERIYTKIFDEFITGSIVFAYQDEWSGELDQTFGALDFLKRHRLDVEGLHVELLPRTTDSFNPKYEQAYQVHIEGVCSTDC